MFFNCFAFLQAIHCHYQSQASSMPSKEEWFTYDTTVFLHLNNHIHNQRKEMQERKQGNDGHLQHIMASLVIIYNLCFDFFFFFSFFDVSYWFVFLLGEGTYCTSISNCQTTVSHSRLYCSLRIALIPAKTLWLHPVCDHSSPKASTVRCSAKWNEIAGPSAQQQHNNAVAPGCLCLISDVRLPPCFRFKTIGTINTSVACDSERSVYL